MSDVVRQPGFFVKGNQIQNRVQKTFVFNEDSGDIDFRIESNNDDHLFFLDAGNDRIGLSTNAPSDMLTINNDQADQGGLRVQQDAVLDGGKNAFSVYSNQAHINGDSSLIKMQQDHASATQHLLEMVNDGTGMAQKVTNNGTGEAFRFEQNAVLGGSKTAFAIYSNQAHVNGDSFLLKIEQDNASSTQPLAKLKNDGTGANLILDQDANAMALYIDKDVAVNDTRTWAMQIDSDNSGTGTALPGGIDMSSFSVDEPLIKAVADAVSTAGTLSQQIAVDIGGTTYYLYAYTTGS